MTAGLVLDAPSLGATADKPVRARWWRWLRRVLLALAAMALAASPWWGPRSLAQLDFFHVRRIEFEGVRYASPNELLARLRVDTTNSVWDDLSAMSRRVARHPLVLQADVSRRLPGTLIVTVVERMPVALLEGNDGMTPLDVDGHKLPIDPAHATIDAPIVAAPDSAVLRLLDALRTSAPRMYARVIDVRRMGHDELRISLKGVVVRAMDDVTVERFEDILRVEESLAKQNLRAVELDVRFRDQVIARLP